MDTVVWVLSAVVVVLTLAILALVLVHERMVSRLASTYENMAEEHRLAVCAANDAGAARAQSMTNRRAVSVAEHAANAQEKVQRQTAAFRARNGPLPKTRRPIFTQRVGPADGAPGVEQTAPSQATETSGEGD